MIAVMSFSVSVWMVDLAFASVMLAVGFAAARWLNRTSPLASGEAERALQAVQRLQDLATSVAQNVGEHSSRVRELSTGLSAGPQGQKSNWDDVVVGSVADIIKANERLQEQLATAEVRLQHQAAELETQVAVARTDALTGLHNRRAFDDELNRRFAEWERRKTPFSLLMVDVDHFKKFNDQHGHQAGDQVLRDVATALSKTTRDMDLVARYGGEEFAIILPVTSLPDALRASQRARAAVEASITRFGGADLRVTTSIGVGQISAGDTSERLVQRADEALYAAKKAGRNCAWYHDNTKCLPAESTSAETALPAKPSDESAAPDQAQAAAGRSAAAPPANDVRTLTAFCTDLRRRVLECQNFNVPLSLVLLDIDEFKSITDGFGPSVRELVLETIGEFLGSSIQEIDVVSRYGEGRFAIMLPGTDLAGAAQLGERARSAIAACGMQIGKSEIHFTISLGLAQAGASDDPSSLIKRADAALFASKAAGGNCAHSHNGKTYEPVVAPPRDSLVEC